MNSHKTNFSLLIFTSLIAFMLFGLCFETSGDTKSNVAPDLANSEKRVLKEDPLRDKRLLTLTKYDKLTREITPDKSYTRPRNSPVGPSPTKTATGSPPDPSGISRSSCPWTFSPSSPSTDHRSRCKYFGVIFRCAFLPYL